MKVRDEEGEGVQYLRGEEGGCVCEVMREAVRGVRGKGVIIHIYYNSSNIQQYIVQMQWIKDLSLNMHNV